MRSPLGALLRRPTNQAPVPYTARGVTRTPWWRPGGVDAQMRAMGSVGTLFAIVDRLATSTASPGWGMFRQAKEDQRPEDRTKVTSHLALDIWNKPNPFFTRQLLMETVQQHYELVGEGWLVISRHAAVRSIPLELWPVSPSRMTPIPDRNDYLVGYIYSSPDGEQIPLALDEVIQIRRPNPVDPYRGIGAVQTILSDLEGVQLSAEWNRNFFRNSAEPGGIIEVPERLEDDEFNEMRERWNEQHKGVANAHRVAILEHGRWVDRTVSQRDMQFAELRGVSREVIREAFGITKFAIGDVEDINRATGEAAKTWFAEQMTVPRLERWKQVLNNQYLPLFGTTGKGNEFDYISPVPEDKEAENDGLTAKSNAAALLATTGYDPASVLETVGLPPMKWIGPPAGAGIPLPHNTPAPPAARLTATQVIDAPRALPVAPVRAADGDRLPPEDLPDTSAVQAAWTAALADLIEQWAAVFAEWIDAVIARIRPLIASGDRAGLAGIRVPQGDVDHASALIKAAMVRLAHDAASQVVHEADGQGVDLSAGIPDADALGDVADIVAQNLARQAEVTASREALRLSTPGTDGDDEAERVATGVRQRLEDDEQDDARPWLGNALTQAQHAGRVATYAAGEAVASGPVPAYYASEKNDAHTCVLCREVNGRWLGNSIAEADAEYPNGGYVRCLGRERCRGDVVAVWRPKQTGGAA